MHDSDHGDAAVMAAARKASRLTFEPTSTPDDIIVKSFMGTSSGAAGGSPGSVGKNAQRPASCNRPPFPRLHPTVVEVRAMPYTRQVDEERKRAPPPIIAIPTPTTPWYPEKPKAPILGKPLAPNLATSLTSPRASERTVSRNNTVAEVNAKLGGQIHINCRMFLSCFCAEMNDKGLLSAVQVTKVFKEACDVVDISLIDSLFQLLDTKRRGYVHVVYLMAAMDTILNGAFREKIRRACFEPFNLDGRGYIHKQYLDTLRKAGKDLPPSASSIPSMALMLSQNPEVGSAFDDTQQQHQMMGTHTNISPQRASSAMDTASGLGSTNSGGGGGASLAQFPALGNNNATQNAVRTPEMVKVLADIFAEIAKDEEEVYITSLSKGKKKAKKKAPPLKSNQKSIIPVNRARITHMNFSVFDGYFETSKTLALVFARFWLPLVESNTDIRMHIVEKLQDVMDN